MKIHNEYGVGNNLRTFHVSTMKIEPVAGIWSLQYNESELLQKSY